MTVEQALEELRRLWWRKDEEGFNDLLKTLSKDYGFDADDLLLRLMQCS